MDIKKEVEQILFSGYDYAEIKNGIDALYEKLSQSTGLDAGDLTHDHMTKTKNGMVVTPKQAAHCLKDLMRTTKFLRGIHKAIGFHLSKKESVNILYAGCGPYATLLTPFTALYTAQQVRFTLLDIEDFSLEKVKRLYDDWGLGEFVEEYRLADATHPDLAFDNSFDLIISETMQVGLKNECQVPITRNLVRFLAEGGTFIPEKIALQVYMTGTLDVLAPKNTEKVHIGTAYDFDTNNLPEKGATSTLQLQENDLQYLRLFTEIHLFQDEVLKERESGLTIPLVLDRFEKVVPRKVHFRYEESEKPELKYDYEF